MKFFAPLIAFAALVSVSASTIEKRASVNDIPTVGFATTGAGTTGGSGGTTTTVTTLAALTAAVAGTAKKIVIISGTITGSAVVKIGSNTSVIGQAGATLEGVGLRVLNESNVIIRNIIIKNVLAEVGDAVGVQAASQVWIDHLDLSSNKDHDKDYYDGLLDLTHGVFGITVTNTKLHDHYKGSLVGHSDSNAAEDVAIRVTYANNYFYNIGSRTPSFRFGIGHIFNNVFDNNEDGINTRVNAQLLVENNVWSGAKKPLYSTDEGFAVSRGNDFGNPSQAPSAPVGTFTLPPYQYTLLATASSRAAVVGVAGATLTF